MSVKKQMITAINDYLNEEDLQPSPFDSRYEVGKNGNVIEHFARFSEAVSCARLHGDGTTIFDRMARHGKPQTWTVSGAVLYVSSERD